MALVLADRVRETTTTTGTGSVTLAGAYTGFQTFSAGVGNTNSTYYTIANVSSGEWEVGIGTYTTSGNTLSRTTVLSSSNGGSLVNFGAGAKDVFVTQPAERALYVASAGTGLESQVTAFTNGGIVYASSTSALATGSALTWNGTALAVTGTLSTTGAFTTTGGSNVQTSWTLAEAGTRSLVLKNPTSTLNASVGTGTNHDLQVEGNIVYVNTGSFGSRSIVGTFSSTGLAVTGALSATRSGNTVATFTQTSATGYGLTILPGADTVYDAFTINNAANTLNQIQMFGNGNAIFKGDVGIGTSSIHPNARLDVRGVNRTGNSTNAVILTTTAAAADVGGTLGLGGLLDGSSSTMFGVIRGGKENSTSGNYAGYLSFGTVANASSITERMRIDSSGNLLVGATSVLTYGKLSIAYSGTPNYGLTIKETTDASSTVFALFSNSSDVSCGSISRVALTNAVAYNTTSDYRLKTVTGAVTGQGARIDALKPIDYLWTNGGQQARGFLAHEFQTVYPNSVTGDKDAVDADGNPKHQSMQAATSEVIADLVAEIQSLRKRLADAGI
jgi:hypothetical protein